MSSSLTLCSSDDDDDDNECGVSDDMCVARYVFLDASRTLGSAWLLSVRRTTTGVQVAGSAHEAMPDVFRVRGSIPAGRGPPRATDPASQAKVAFAKRRGMSVDEISGAEWATELTRIAAAGTSVVPDVGIDAGPEAESEAQSCWVCLEEDGELLRGCACRGTAGYVHVDCLAMFASSRTHTQSTPAAQLDAWRQCVTCKQYFVGELFVGLARAHNSIATDADARSGTQLPTADQCARDMSLASGLINSEKKEERIEAIRKGEQCVAKSRRIPFKLLPGDLHPNTIVHIKNLAIFYQTMVYHDDTRTDERTRYHARQLALMEEAVASHRTLEQLLPAVAAEMNMGHTLGVLGQVYDNAGRTHEARPLMEEGLEITRRTLGDDAVETLVCAQNLGMFYKKQGDFVTALSLMRDTFPKMRRVLGSDHPHVLKHAQDLADTCIHQGGGRITEEGWEEALPLFVALLKARRRARLDLSELHQQVGEAYIMVGAYAKGTYHYGECVAGMRRNGDTDSHNMVAFQQMKEAIAAHINPCTGVAEAIAPAILTRLSSRPELNGARATVDTFLQEAGRYTVTLSDGKHLNVRPRNLVLPLGARVTLCGLATVRYNGLRGTVRGRGRDPAATQPASVDEDEELEMDGRVDVYLTGEQKAIRVKLENVLLTRYDAAPARSDW